MVKKPSVMSGSFSRNSIGPTPTSSSEASFGIHVSSRWGTLAHAIVPPLSLCGPVLNVRKFAAVPLTPDDLVEGGTLAPHMMGFLAACVRGRANVVVSGGTSSGRRSPCPTGITPA